nr:uncharacterized protein LOC113736006 isoform X2 [Coffea arabica]
MEGEEAKLLLGFPPHSHPSPSQVKTAYKSKVWDTHPDRFPPHLKSNAEHRFNIIFKSCEKWSSKSMWQWGASRSDCCSLPPHCSEHCCFWRINCYQVLQKTKGGLSFS